jgi:hypothetical protein
MTTAADLEGHVESGEALRFQAPLRRGGRVGITDDRVLVVRDDGTTSIQLGTIAEVTVQSFDWFLAILSAVLVGFGVLSFERSAVGGLVFAGFGIASLYWTYRKRGQVQLHLHNRRKAVTFSMDATDEFRGALDTALEPYRDRLDDETRSNA